MMRSALLAGTPAILTYNRYSTETVSAATCIYLRGPLLVFAIGCGVKGILCQPNSSMDNVYLPP